MARRIWDFPGGVHPPENKKQSSETEIKTLPLPKTLVVPVQQHIGNAARPCVEVGDRVLKGQRIADANGFVSLPVHAPTSGTVTAIDLQPVQHPSQMDSLCISIECDGQEQWVEHHGVEDFQKLDKADLLDIIRNAGIAGMGGAGFPSSIKLSVNPERKIQQLILNAVECEPYITADDRLMRERAQDIVTGLEIMSRLVEPEVTLIGIEDNKPEAIAAIKQAATNTAIEVVVVPTKYPSGGEKQLIQLLTGKEVRSGGIPADVGVVCQNVGTAYAVKRAVLDGEPLISRITTLTGEAVKHKGNYEVLLGTPLNWVLQQAGADQAHIHRLIMGGPMMGFAVHNANVPVVKTTNCLLVPNDKELQPPVAEQPCIRCASCAQVCPAHLLPQQLYWFSKSKEFDKASHYNLADCIECGACSYVCPSHIPLVQYFRFAKGSIRTQQQETAKSDHARERFEARQARLDREEREKELKRKQRAEAAAAKQAQKKSAPATTEKATESEPKQDQAKDLSKLQTTSASTMKRYKEAKKALEQAEKNGADNLAALQKKVDQLKTKADMAKAAFLEAKKAQGTGADETSKPADDPLAALKKASADDFNAYKEAQQKLEQAQAAGEDTSELSQQLAQLKAKSDASKAAMKEARAKQKEQIQKQNAAKDPMKAAKMEVAKQQVLLKKANKALEAAADDAQRTTLNQAVKDAETALATAEAELEKIEEAEKS